MQKAYRQGPDEVVRESALLSRSWNFELSGIQIPIYAFHGDTDTMAPYDVVAAAVANIPNGQLIRIRNGGILSSKMRKSGVIFYVAYEMEGK